MSFTRREQVEAVAYLDLSHLVYDHSEAGRCVRIVRPDQPLDPGGYKIRALVHNTRTGTSWYEMFGGDRDPKGRRHFKAVRPEHVRDMSRREAAAWFPVETRAADLADQD